MRPDTSNYSPPSLPTNMRMPDPGPETGWLEHVYTLAMVVVILVGLWLWSSATMYDGAARTYQCSAGNQKTFVCADPPRTHAPTPAASLPGH